MTIATTLSTKSVTGDGTVNPINFPYKTHAADEIKVYLVVEVDGILTKQLRASGVDYSVALAGDFSSCDVTPTAAFAAAALNKTIYIARILPFTQGHDIDVNPRLDGAELEKDLDRIIMRFQQLKDEFDDFQNSLPAFPVPNAAAVLGWNINGDLVNRLLADALAGSIASASDAEALAEVATDRWVRPSNLAAVLAAAALLTKIKAVDGVGSGLDADLLDGQHGAYYAVASQVAADIAAAVAATGINLLDNSSFAILHRGPGPWTMGAPTYTVDRWSAFRTGSSAGMTVSRQSAAAGAGVRHKMRVQRDSGNSGTAGLFLCQALASAQSIPFAGRTVTVSFSITAGANFSAAAAALRSRLATGTGTDQLMSGGPGETWTGSAINDQINTISTARTRFTHTFTAPSNATQIGLSFDFTPVGTAGAADYFEIDSVDFKIGDKASVYVPKPDHVEFDNCAMFYEDLARDAFTGLISLRVPVGANANSNSGGVQYFWAVIPHKTKRNKNSTLTMGDGATGWHITMAAAGSYYNLVVFEWSHPTLNSTLFQFSYIIDGSHPVHANGLAGLLATDDHASAKMAISCDLAA